MMRCHMKWISVGHNSQWKKVYFLPRPVYYTVTSTVVLVKVRMWCRTASVRVEEGEGEKVPLGHEKA